MNARQVITVFALGILPACGSDGGTAPASYTVDVTPASVPLTRGATATLNATVTRKLGANSIVDNAATVAWSSDNVNVATVTPTGRTATVTTTGVGTAIITASSNSARGTATILVTAPINASFVRLIGGGSHACGETPSGEIFCWGGNASGQLGDNSTAQKLLPSRAVTTLRFGVLAAGAAHTCAIGVPGSASSCWGDGQFGQLGNGGVTNALTPSAIQGSLNWVELSAGDRHTCGLASGGAIYCWGSGSNGQLGTGRQTSETTPVPVQAGSLRFTAVAAGGLNTCAITESSQTYCWGSRFGASPVLIAGGLAFTSLRLGSEHSCGLIADGSAYCWGSNQSGQLGTGGPSESLAPAGVQTSLRFSVLTAGATHTCGLALDAVAYCWGSNTDSQLGIGITAATQATPVRVVGGFTFSGIRAGSRHTCGLANGTGAAVCWGLNSSGQLGDGTTITRSSPVFVLGN